MSNKNGVTKYPGVYFRTPLGSDGPDADKTFYIRYRRGGRESKLINEPVGKASQGMTAAKANAIRTLRINGKELSNTENRAAKKAEKKKADAPWTLSRVWGYYSEAKKGRPIMRMDTYLTKYFGELAERPIETITTRDIDALSRKLSQTPTVNRPDKMLSPQTVKHVLGLIKRMLRFADRQGYCLFPQGLHITMPTLDNEKTETMTETQMRAYLAALDEEQDQVAASYLRICLMTGIRKTALLSLQWADIDFARNIITLRGEYAKKGKTDYVPLTPAVKEIFNSLPKGKSPFVFPGDQNGHRGGFVRVAKRVRDKAGLPADFRPIHGLRHTFASFLASSGKVDIYTLQKLMTHGSPQMTQRYAHLADAALQRAASVANDMLQVQNKEN